jgi:PAS domain S-box-containing protein
MDASSESVADESVRLRQHLSNLKGMLGRAGLLRGEDTSQDVTLLLDGLFGIATEVEQRIAQQTAELAAANDRLQREVLRRVQAEDAVRASERDWRLIIDNLPAGIVLMKPDGEVEVMNQPMLTYFGRTFEELKGWTASDVVHPDDRQSVLERFVRSVQTGEPYINEERHLGLDGAYRWFQVRGKLLRGQDGGVVRWCVLHTDIDERRRAEDAVRSSERDLKLIIDTIPGLAWSARPDGGADFFNRHYLEFVGLAPERVRDWGWTDAVHPHDLENLATLWRQVLLSEVPGSAEARLRRHDGEYRWCLFRVDALRDQAGKVVKWYGINTDIEDRKRTEAELGALKDQLYRENLALRHEVDRTSMFEEIVGASKTLKTVLSRIAKVAPTDSTVFISGETGTGKELIARAVHKRSSRAGRAFVSVNCAALAPTLISSELFGHEKGAFTGATQRRLGRFELADGGTIFLDEVGELLPETQAMLLRVLQEREFERVGGTHPVEVDVRVIAATNRDLKAAIGAGSFRQDLYYRLNVFPIEVPPLRERRDDLLMLVEYFVQRYASRAGKHVRSIDKKTLDLLQAYDWPGNIRELQNVIERSVILSSGSVFAVDELWLSTQSLHPVPRTAPVAVNHGDPRSEREIIETALAESRGRVAGPSGAAAKLNTPARTLEHRIKALKIDKSRFKFR